MRARGGRLKILAWIGVAMLLAPLVAAADTASGAPISKREAVVQVVKCMRRRMAADRMLSYNQAAKDCKEFVLNGGSASPPLVASDGSTPK
jgi:hypothetical protein